MAKVILNGVIGLAGVTGVVLTLKNILGPYKYKATDYLTDKTVLITGTTCGLGEELAFNLSTRNAKLILACRDIEKCHAVRRSLYTQTHNINIRCEELDLSSQKSIREFSERIHKKEKKIDVLVHNAGVMMPNPRMVSEDLIEQQLAVNFLGPYLVTKLLSDLMIRKPEDKRNSRIVTLICPEYKKGTLNFQDFNSDIEYKPGLSFYQSQLARVLIMKEFAEQLKSQGITLFLVDPGVTDTNLRRHLPQNNNIVTRLMTGCWNGLAYRFKFQGVITPFYCVVEKSLDETATTGELYFDCAVQEIPSDIVEDTVLRRRLTLLAEKWTEKSAAQFSKLSS